MAWEMEAQRDELTGEVASKGRILTQISNPQDSCCTKYLNLCRNVLSPPQVIQTLIPSFENFHLNIVKLRQSAIDLRARTRMFCPVIVGKSIFSAFVEHMIAGLRGPDCRCVSSTQLFAFLSLPVHHGLCKELSHCAH